MIPRLLLIYFSFLYSFISHAQQSEDTLIRNLENAEREAILKGDTTQLYSLMSKNIIVQNPENTIAGFRQIMDRIKTGKINYTSFERRIDHLGFINNVAIVMGLETLVPQGETKNAGKTVKRRFTNIWIKENGSWKLSVRQATIISID